MSHPSRLDAALVERGLARSRGDAKDLIAHGRAVIDGRVATKPAQPVTTEQIVEVAGAVSGWVSRAAYKLLAAIEAFQPAGLHVRGRRALDVGASTGGFTQVLLAAGASHVVALDVGHDQLAPIVGADPRVTEVSSTNIRDVRPGDLGDPFALIVGDLSFISLRLILPVLRPLAAELADLVLLVKPQFEVGRDGVGKRGVVSGAAPHLAALTDVCQVAQDCGLGVRGVEPSPLPGNAGNREYLVWFSTDRAAHLPDLADRIVRAVEARPTSAERPRAVRHPGAPRPRRESKDS